MVKQLIQLRFTNAKFVGKTIARQMLVGVIGVALMVNLVAAEPASVAPQVSVTIAQGEVHGVWEEGVISFRGIPFAMPPTGNRRWSPPSAAPRWKLPLEATAYGPACLQTPSTYVSEQDMSEDCLNLNVWTPSITDGKRPVMVWVHGGGFSSGSGRVDGAAFAREGVVLVSFNYRLGSLGFFAHDALTERDANFGLLDMVLALQWVRENAASFGGDASKVTIFGVSAGGMAVNMLMASPLSKDLFDGAIAQSGYGTWPLMRSRHARDNAPLNAYGQPADSAEGFAKTLVAGLVNGKTTAAKLRQVDARALVDALQGFQVPIVDGHSLPYEPGVAFLLGTNHKVPFVTGGASYEGSVMPGSGISEQDFKRSWGARMDTARQLYASDFAVGDSLGTKRLFGDTRYLGSSRTLGRAMARAGQPTWLYYLDFPKPPSRSEWPGTPHAMGSVLLMHGNALAFDEQQQTLASALRRYWVNFARRGDPNGAGLPAWPTHSAANDSWLTFGAEPKATTGVQADKLDLIEARYRERVAAALQ